MLKETSHPLIFPNERSFAYRNWMDLLTGRFREALPFSGPIDTVLTLGSGVSGSIQAFSLDKSIRFTFGDIGLPEGANQHHPKEIIAGITQTGKKIVAFTGRTAAFEIDSDGVETEAGHVKQMEAATAYLEIVNRIGAKNLILTTAAGGINHPLHIKEPWPVEKGREWLINDGLGTDIIPHTHALAETILGLLGINQEIILQDVKRFKYRDNLAQKSIGRNETYMNLSGRVGNIDVLMEGGKGLDQVFYGAKITFSEGKVELCIGTESCYPYILVMKNSDPDYPTFYNFQKSGMVGYEGTLMDFFRFSQNLETLGPSRERRWQIAEKGLIMLHEAYKRKTPIEYHNIGTYPNLSNPILTKLNQKAMMR